MLLSQMFPFFEKKLLLLLLLNPRNYSEKNWRANNIVVLSVFARPFPLKIAIWCMFFSCLLLVSFILFSFLLYVFSVVVVVVVYFIKERKKSKEWPYVLAFEWCDRSLMIFFFGFWAQANYTHIGDCFWDCVFSLLHYIKRRSNRPQCAK